MKEEVPLQVVLQLLLVKTQELYRYKKTSGWCVNRRSREITCEKRGLSHQ